MTPDCFILCPFYRVYRSSQPHSDVTDSQLVKAEQTFNQEYVYLL